MTVQELQDANTALRSAVEARLSGAAEPRKRPMPGGVGADAELLPGTVAFLDVLEQLRALHFAKTQDYGAPEDRDSLANVRRGAEVVNIAPWKAALVRIADKVQRLRTYCRTGKLVNEGVEDSLLDLAAYAIIGLVLFREECGRKNLP